MVMLIYSSFTKFQEGFPQITMTDFQNDHHVKMKRCAKIAHENYLYEQ